MFTKLDSAAIDLICCPYCHGELTQQGDSFHCQDCPEKYSAKKFSAGGNEEHIYDFRMHHPQYCIPIIWQRWAELQKEYEDLRLSLIDEVTTEDFKKEIESVREIYSQEFHIEGTVLDVGGHQGRLRHFLNDNEVPLYISIDPYWNIFGNIEEQPGLLEAYPELQSPCNFVSGYAERLPFKNNSFDWVHMRSVVDHFADPFVAFKEAFRVLKPNGHIMVGLAIMERIQKSKKSLSTRVIQKYQQEGSMGVLRSVSKKLTSSNQAENEEDDHMYRLTHAQLQDLLERTGFELEKEHWQKPPFDYCIYLTAKIRG